MLLFFSAAAPCAVLLEASEAGLLQKVVQP